MEHFRPKYSSFFHNEGYDDRSVRVQTQIEMLFSLTEPIFEANFAPEERRSARLAYAWFLWKRARDTDRCNFGEAQREMQRCVNAITRGDTGLEKAAREDISRFVERLLQIPELPIRLPLTYRGHSRDGALKQPEEAEAEYEMYAFH